MKMENLPTICPERLSELMLEAQQKNDCSSRELGELVHNITQKVIFSDEFIAYTDDWKLEMLSQAYVKVFGAVMKFDPVKCKSPVNYLYTAALNSFRTTLKKLKDDSEDFTPINEEVKIEPFNLRNKRRILARATAKLNVRKIVEQAQKSEIDGDKERYRKYVGNIFEYVDRLARIVERKLNANVMDELLQKARNIRKMANG